MTDKADALVAVSYMSKIPTQAGVEAMISQIVTMDTARQIWEKISLIPYAASSFSIRDATQEEIKSYDR